MRRGGAPRRALVTGATGFLGRHVLDRLAALGIEAWTLGRRAPAGQDTAHALALADPGDQAGIRAALDAARPDLVLHLAGSTDASCIGRLYRVNTLFAVHLCQAALAQEERPRVLLLGTAAEYGPVPEDALPVTEETPCRPAGAYGISKLAQSLHGLDFAAAGLPVVVARLYNAIGHGMPEHLALGSFARQIAAMGPAGGTLVTGDLEVERDFVTARDAARILVELAALPEVTGVVDLCSGQPTNLRRLVEAMVAAAPCPVAMRTDPARRGVTALRRHYGAGARLRALGLLPPPPDPAVVAGEILGGAGCLCGPG
jgi:GDP-4-dehydro-6-deoxy-D-mannose reductase